MRFPSCITCVAFALLMPAEAATALEIQLPVETALLPPGAAKGAEAASLCMMCHSVDYLSTQPPMPRGFWQAEVRKMVNTYGAPIPPDQIPLIVEYLDSAYPPLAPAAGP